MTSQIQHIHLLWFKFKYGWPSIPNIRLINSNIDLLDWPKVYLCLKQNCLVGWKMPYLWAMKEAHKKWAPCNRAEMMPDMKWLTLSLKMGGEQRICPFIVFVGNQPTFFFSKQNNKVFFLIAWCCRTGVLNCCHSQAFSLTYAYTKFMRNQQEKTLSLKK